MTRAVAHAPRLSRREFARALRLGLGRARIDVRRHGLAGREDLLVAVCLRNPTRDTQLEGHIVGWLLDIARDGGATALVRRAVLEAASRRISNRRDRDQISSFLARFALDGDRVAARALLRMIDRQTPCALIAPNAIWGLGEKAWRAVIRSYGRRWAQARRFDWSWIVAVARDELGPRRMLAMLRDETNGRAHLRPMAEVVEAENRDDRSGYRERPVDPSLDALERLVRGPRRPGIHSALRRWTRNAAAADRLESWRRLTVETEPRRLLHRLWAWGAGRETPPSLHPRLFDLLRHEVRLVRVNAAMILGRFRHQRIREVAFRMLRRDATRAIDGAVLYLLDRNVRHDDAAFVAAVLPRRASREIRDGWARCVMSLAETRRSREWTALLIRAMATTPCRECRWRALHLLVDRGAATEPMLREALFDADKDARELVRETLAKLRPARARGGSRGRR